MHDYYYYTKEELLKNPKIPLIVMEDNAAVFCSIAEEMAEEIRGNSVYAPYQSTFYRLSDIRPY